MGTRENLLGEAVLTSTHEYPQSMFSNRNKKNNIYPCKAQFYYIKVGLKGGGGGGQNYVGVFTR